jgi:hypothetical protein
MAASLVYRSYQMNMNSQPCARVKRLVGESKDRHPPIVFSAEITARMQGALRTAIFATGLSKAGSSSACRALKSADGHLGFVSNSPQSHCGGRFFTSRFGSSNKLPVRATTHA